MRIRDRKLLLGFLVAAFIVQTTLVYADDTKDRFGPLDPLAAEGRALWHRHNCYTCHQLYGFGGFLGPDLTNVTSRVDRARFDAILTNGSELLQMPAFHFDAPAIDALVAFFTAVDRTGVGQARQSPPPSVTAIDEAIAAVAERAPMPDAAARGFATFRTSPCIACHRILYANPLGMITAADLSTATARWTDDQLERTLTEGRPQLGMPATGLGAEQRRDLIAWMHWLFDQRSAIRDQLGPTASTSLPWWEFAAAEGAR